MESNTWCPRLTAAMMRSGSAVQVKGLGSLLVSARKRLMAAWRSTPERKTPRFSRRRESLAKKPSTALSQDWREVEDEPLVPGKPGANLGMLVGGIVVEDDVDDLADRYLSLDRVQKADELLMAVALHAAPENGSLQHIERGEQGGGAMPLVIMGHGAGAPLLQRQPRLSAVEGLDLRFLVDRQHDGMGRRINVEPDHVAQFGDELGVGREFELTVAVRLQSVRFPNAPHRTGADATRSRHHVGGPVGGLARRRAERRSRAEPSPPAAAPGGLVLSRRSPSTPSCIKRSCQRQTTGLALPDRRITSKVPQPSAVARMILARQTCFCGELRCAMIASSRPRSSDVTMMTIPYPSGEACDYPHRRRAYCPA